MIGVFDVMILVMGFDDLGAHVGAPLRGHPNDHPHPDTPEKYGLHNKKYNATVGDAMDWFKTMTTNEYIRGVKNHDWQRFDGKLWQRNYWEHIIRNETSGERIAQYIINNPQKWDDDMFRLGLCKKVLAAIFILSHILLILFFLVF